MPDVNECFKLLDESERAFVSGFEQAVNAVENAIIDYEDECDEDTLGKIKKEIAEQILGHVKEWLESDRDEVIIALADNHPEEEEGEHNEKK